ncbi:anthocyanidin 3-o-glucosyltransferase 5 [Phtheirospermum japonicum]|uniref:Glycosyltransferase n=1 Tax=Phtheirospermum japonicum TaxID=374723 RepID=A0A830BED0_9LAMI|nr:anthocyanidin 3-o-glucosyltransferase 5 [Phtheirospermum japonicum]
MDTSINNLDVAIVSSPGMGHLIPVLVLANRLATHHNANVTVLLITTAQSPPPESDLLRLNLCHHLVRIIELPPVDISHLVGPSTHVVTKLCLMVRSALPLIRSAIAAMDRLPDALVADLFCTETQPIADEFNMAKYLFVPTTALFTALTVHCPVLDREIHGQYVDQLEPLKIPGCKPVRPEDIVEPMLDRDDQQYHEYVRIGKQFLLFDGILLNTCENLEPETLQAFRENETWRSIMKTPVYPIGPLSRPLEPKDESSDVIGWLDRQPNESVIFVSFGSGGMLSAEQITELAWGLELSQQRFVWVVRPPTKGKVDDAFFSIGSGFDGTPNYLPDGFITRVHGKGLLIPGWAQQAQILDHPAVGGFISHCGWNSTLESITSGVPIIAWPLYAEQRLNATILAEEVGVAVRPRVLPTKAVVGREEIESLVRRLMEHEEGREMRDKVKQLRISAMEGLKNGGQSHKAMCEMLSAIASRRGSSKGA